MFLLAANKKGKKKHALRVSPTLQITQAEKEKKSMLVETERRGLCIKIAYINWVTSENGVAKSFIDYSGIVIQVKYSKVWKHLRVCMLFFIITNKKHQCCMLYFVLCMGNPNTSVGITFPEFMSCTVINLPLWFVSYLLERRMKIFNF